MKSNSVSFDNNETNDLPSYKYISKIYYHYIGFWEGRNIDSEKKASLGVLKRNIYSLKATAFWGINGKNIPIYSQIKLKNHFHSCIIKSERRLISNKYETNLKDNMGVLYSLYYLKQLILKIQCSPLNKNAKLEKKKDNFNPYSLFKSKKLSVEKIDKYTLHLFKFILFHNPLVKYLTEKLFIFPPLTINIEIVSKVFSMIIKSKIFINTYNLISSKRMLLKPENKKLMVEFLNRYQYMFLLFPSLDRKKLSEYT